MKSRFVGLALAMGAFLPLSSYAGIFTSLPVTNLPPTNYVSVLGEPANTATLEAVLPTPTTTYTVEGTTEGDPLLDIIQKATNTTSYAWGSYTLTINPTPGSVIVPDSITVDPDMALFNYPNITDFLSDVIIDQVAHTVTFSAKPGEKVPLGQKTSIWVSFDVLADSTGYYGYILTNTPSPYPVPEPASIGLLGLGALALLARTRRA